MIKILQVNTEFLRNVLQLITGTVIAQAIPILIMPILTRLWTPEEFGFYANYMALVGILAAIATGRLDMALMLPKKNTDSIRILQIALVFAITFSLSLYLLVYLFNQFTEHLAFQFKIWYYLVPIGVLFTAIYSVVIAWQNRVRNYKLMSQSRIIQSGSISFMQIAIGSLANLNSGMILSDVLGRLISIITILKQTDINHRSVILSKVRMIALLKRYKKFPLIEAPASLVNIISQYLPLIILPLIISPEIAGLYFLAFRVLLIPISLIGKAVLEIFKNQVQKDFGTNGHCKDSFIRTGILLFLVGMVPTIILILYAPYLFGFVFGEEWREAGKIAQILAPLALIQFVAGPLSYILIFCEELALDLKCQFFYLILISGSLWLAAGSTIYSIAFLLMLSGIIFYLALIFWSFKHAAAIK